MNIFTKIGNNIEKERKEKKKIRDRYWKLSASERIDYDNKLEKIRNKKIPILQLTNISFKSLMIFILFISFLAFTVSMPINNLLDLLRKLSLLFMKIIVWIICLDAIILLEWFIKDDSKKQLKELNKRFKLK